ncbi:MAG: hypothetical protein GC203_20400 [Phenylobacterium sp.]|uniref:hypothetical protein n=1 Tax=Phenylobacterium sp. TaxID=1871053 RepID=UPI0025E44423|nr:hypothetical protein [Phenylobacterium sp.]MBI1200226.1 hypothetical protein [Phenylobacterium sp.]
MSRRANPGYQVDETSARIAGLTLLGLIALIPLSALLMWAMFLAFAAWRPGPPPTPAQPSTAAAPAPQLQAAPMAERLVIERAADDRLSGYAWIDRQAGLARIPIGRAMAIQATRGWPDAEARP